MSGNVWEWCWDRYGSLEEYEDTDPSGLTAGVDRVVRGGSWNDDPTPVTRRNRRDPITQNGRIGFRIARTLA